MAKKKDDFDWIDRFVRQLIGSDAYSLMSVVTEKAHDETSAVPKVVVPITTAPIEGCDFISNAHHPVCLASEPELEATFEQTKDAILDEDNPSYSTKNRKYHVERLRKHRFNPTPFPALSLIHDSDATLYIPTGFNVAESVYSPDIELPMPIDFTDHDMLIMDLHRYSIKAPDLNHDGKPFKVTAVVVQPVRVGTDRAGLLVTALGDNESVKAHRALMMFDDQGRLDTDAMAQYTTAWRNTDVRLNTEDESREFTQRMMMLLVHRINEIMAILDDNDAEEARQDRIKNDRELALRIHPQLIEPYDEDEDIDSAVTVAHSLLHAYDDALRNLDSAHADLQACEAKYDGLTHTLEQQAVDHKREMDLALDRIKQLETAKTNSDTANTSSAAIVPLQSTIDNLKEQLDAAHGIQQVVADMTLPKNTFDSLSLAAQFWPDRLIVLDRAYASAKSFDGPAEEPFTHLQALACILWPLVFEENSNHPAQDFAERTTVHMTMKVNKRQLDNAFFDEYHLTYKGQTRDFHAHTKGANFRRGQSLRIHFFFDREERKIVIAHCGDHLTNTMTPHLS